MIYKYIYVLSNFHDSTPPHPPKKQGEISEIHHLSPFFKPQPRLRKKKTTAQLPPSIASVPPPPAATASPHRLRPPTPPAAGAPQASAQCRAK